MQNLIIIGQDIDLIKEIITSFLKNKSVRYNISLISYSFFSYDKVNTNTLLPIKSYTIFEKDINTILQKADIIVNTSCACSPLNLSKFKKFFKFNKKLISKIKLQGKYIHLSPILIKNKAFRLYNNTSIINNLIKKHIDNYNIIYTSHIVDYKNSINSCLENMITNHQVSLNKNNNLYIIDKENMLEAIVKIVEGNYKNKEFELSFNHRTTLANISNIIANNLNIKFSYVSLLKLKFLNIIFKNSFTLLDKEYLEAIALSKRASLSSISLEDLSIVPTDTEAAIYKYLNINNYNRE